MGKLTANLSLFVLTLSLGLFANNPQASSLTLSPAQIAASGTSQPRGDYSNLGRGNWEWTFNFPKNTGSVFTGGGNNPFGDLFTDVEVDPVFLSLLETFGGGNVKPEDIGKVFAGGNGDALADLFGTDVDPVFLSLLEAFGTDGFNYPEDIGKLFAGGGNNPFLDLFAGADIDPVFLSLLQDFARGDGNFNFPGGVTVSTGGVITGNVGIPNNNTAVPEPSSVLGLLAFGMATVAWKRRKRGLLPANGSIESVGG